jgi:hypothetical protein
MVCEDDKVTWGTNGSTLGKKCWYAINYKKLALTYVAETWIWTNEDISRSMATNMMLLTE